MKPFKRILFYRSAIVGLLALFALVSYEFSALVPKANAIPAFARKYNFACNVCHVPGFPKLNDFGNLFRDQGYQLGTDADLPTSQGITMGFWPVSFRTTVGYQVANIRTDGQGLASSGFGFTGLDVLSFGTLHRNIAFGLVYTPGLNSAGFGTGSGVEDDSNLESAFVRLMNLERFVGGGTNTYWLNLRVGKYELDLPFSEKRSPTLNTPFVMYHYVSGTVYQGGPISGLATSPGYFNANAFGLGDNQPGLELAGIIKTEPTGGYLRYSLNMITANGGSFSDTNGGIGRSAAFYGHVTQSFGGYGIVTGQRLGAFVVYGTAPTQCPASTGGQSINFNGGNCPQPGTGTQGEGYTRVGADASITFDGQWNLFGAYMHAVDSSNLIRSQSLTGLNAGGGTNFQNAAWNGGFVELDWYPTVLPFFGSPGWLFTYRYDLIRNERQGDPTFAKSFNNVDSQTVMARYYIHQSARTDLALHMEYNYYKDKGVGANSGNLYGQTTLIGLDFAF